MGNSPYINQECPECSAPSLVDISTNFKKEWACPFCEETFDPDRFWCA